MEFIIDPKKLSLQDAAGMQLVGLLRELALEAPDGNLSGFFVTPEYYGAKGDGTTNDAAAFEKALKTGKTVLVSNKTYYIGTPLSLASNGQYAKISMIGCGKGVSNIHLASSFTASNLDSSIIGNINFYCETSDNNESYVFPGVLRNTKVEGCQFYRFKNIFYRVEQCCIIRGNWFRALKEILFRQCTDGFISDNYVSGSGGNNPRTILFFDSLTSSVLKGNFFSYCYRVFSVASTMDNNTITGNIFALCYCIFYNHIGGTTFTGNTIMGLKKSDGWDVSGNSDMNTGKWCVMKRELDYDVNFGWENSVLADNTIIGDFDMYMDCNDLERFKTHDLLVDEMYPADKFKFGYRKNEGISGDASNIMIRPMLGRTVQTLPSASLTGDDIVSFNRDKVTMDGVVYINIDGNWKTDSIPNGNSSGQFLGWDGSNWVASSLPVYSGGVS